MKLKNYTKIKSRFIKDELKRTKWEDHEYIDELIFIEEYALDKWKPTGFSSGMYWSSVVRRHKKEYAKIMKELNPKKYEKELKAEKKRKEQIKLEEAERAKKEAAEEKRFREDWIKAGGVI